MHFSKAFCAAFGLFLLADQSSIPSSSLHRSSAPIPPSLDPFYNPSDLSWRFTIPGTILKFRNITFGLTSPSPAIQASYQLLYRTTNAHGHPSHTVTTIIIPSDANLTRLLSYQIAYNSPDINCSPSYWLQDGASHRSHGILGELRHLIIAFLAQGIPMNIPDHEGVNAAFSVGTQTGYSVLDSLRAVTKSGSITGISSAASITMIGYSGGALATEWASELHSSYAPDIRISAAAMGGLPTNITKTFFAIDGTYHAELITAAFNGIANAFNRFAIYIRRHLKPEYASTFYSPRQECTKKISSQLEFSFRGRHPNISSFFDNGNRIVYDQADLINTIGVMGFHGIPNFPLYVWKGTNDEVSVPIEDTDALVKKYCAAGTNITYVRVQDGDHRKALVAGLPGAKGFLNDTYNGIVPTMCTNTTIPAKVGDDANGMEELL
ncbi:hypothetical protein EYZ11_000750 [Aspergillus tanneri]|uniref:Secretory lipase-domain-containing protein n=1 Tax=Aspergillus tanneri TaxID=1220188 RepID=A0A4V3UQP7_9EURO|nr:uncharacterized protein ATNIH1004_003035 [Aspergillus tanneri]KAA8650351.1 hypothetical protein ATNIH1004_003035 [Aspergillus tanneri]THC99820.1 hypothetical protein EYZ11_000750 [Aspergillus tanneri]